MPYADKEKRQAYHREWIAKNRDKVLTYARKHAQNKTAESKEAQAIYAREYRAANLEKRRSAWKDYYKRNRAKVLEKNLKYALANPEKMKSYMQKSNAKPEIKAKQADWARNNPERKKTAKKKYQTSPKGLEANRNFQGGYRKTKKYKDWVAAHQDKIRQYALACYHRHREQYKEYAIIYGGMYPRRAAIYFKWEACDKLCYICGFELLIDAVTIDHVHPKARGGDNNIENLMPAHALCNNRKSARLDFPIARPDLVEQARHIQALPRHSKRTAGKPWAAKHEEYLEMKSAMQAQEAA